MGNLFIQESTLVPERYLKGIPWAFCVFIHVHSTRGNNVEGAGIDRWSVRATVTATTDASLRAWFSIGQGNKRL